MPDNNKVSIYEVGLRDGLQNEAAFVPTDEKLHLIDMLTAAGQRRIEITSFVSPKWIPQLADHMDIAKRASRKENVTYSALVPNARGLDGAKASGLTEIAIFLSASETHSKKNINKSVTEAVAVLGPVAESAGKLGMRVRGYISTVFGCPYEGAIDPAVPHELVHKLLAMGVYEVSLGDTVGVANPRQVRDFMNRIRADVPLEKIALHLHDTRGTALANVYAGLLEGVRTFDSAFGGLGGCPYAPGASGNLSTEDLVYMLEGMGMQTGIDIDKLVDASIYVSDLIGRSLPSKVYQAENRSAR